MADNLGGASFKITADPSQFTKAMDDAEKKAVTSSRAISTSVKEASGALNNVGAAGSNANRGLLQAAYAIDDLQYGFRSIVNNIPQMLMFLGPGIAGAAGVAAVGISQLINHWDDLTGLFSEDKALPKLKTDLEGLAESLREIATEIKALQSAAEAGGGFLGPLTNAVFGSGIKDADRLAALKKLQTEGKEKLQAEHDVNALGVSDEERGVAARVKAAIGKMSEGSGTLMDVLTDQGMTPDEARKAISGASRGNEGALADILGRTKGQGGQGFRELENAPGAVDKAIKAQDAADKQFEKDHERDRKAQEAADKKAAADKKKAAIDDLEDQRTQLLEQHHQEDLNLQAMKEALGHGTQILQGPKAVVDMFQKAAGDQPLVALARAQKAIQEEQRTELKKINANLEKVRRGTFPT